MVVAITRIDNIFETLIKEYSLLGGIIDFHFFKIAGIGDDREGHLLAAQATLHVLDNPLTSKFGKNHGDRYLQVISGVNIVDKPESIAPEIFFGTHFDFQNSRPIINGRKLLNSFFYYDTEETSKNAVLIQEHPIAEFYTEVFAKGYSGSFLYPPCTFAHKKTIKETGQYFLDFNRKIFDDFTRIKVYSWSIDCSDYFNEGKEWWGSHFWTVYNPIQDIYIGIAVSSTD